MNKVCEYRIFFLFFFLPGSVEATLAASRKSDGGVCSDVSLEGRETVNEADAGDRVPDGKEVGVYATDNVLD